MHRTRHASSLNDRSRRPRADATRGGATAASAPHEPPDGDRPSKDAPDDDVPPAAFWLGAAGALLVCTAPRASACVCSSLNSNHSLELCEGANMGMRHTRRLHLRF